MGTLGEQHGMAIVADDDPTVRVLARAALEEIGLSVEDTDDGVSALNLAAMMAPDIVFLDVTMPGMDGFRACVQMRRRFGDQFPIVMITGMDDPDSIRTAYESGATDFVTKPVNWELFKHRVQFVLRGRAVLKAWSDAREKSNTILDALPDTVVLVGSEGQVLDFRAGGSLERECFVGATGDRFREAAPELVDDRVMSFIEGVARSRRPYSSEHSARLRGQERDYEIRLVPIGDADVLCIFRDVSSRKEYARLITDYLSDRHHDAGRM
jgi:CheY-like chemotaxis protein